MHFLRKQLEVHPCSEMSFLREQLFYFFYSWLLISVATPLCFHGCLLAWLLPYVFYQSLHHKQNFFILDMIKYKFRVIEAYV